MNKLLLLCALNVIDSSDKNTKISLTTQIISTDSSYNNDEQIFNTQDITKDIVTTETA